ncbi:MAG: hypothetical protein OXH52_07700 [Gammaproteobacteria bacterium]|nr:hypothetical protein [Gammaproteobacteria bacterium]
MTKPGRARPPPPGGLRTDVDQARELTLDNMAQDIDNGLFDVRNAVNDATDLHERMVRDEHR